MWWLFDTVHQDGRALGFMKEQTEEICKLAVKNGEAVQYVLV